MANFTEHFHTAPDGVKTYYRRYPTAGSQRNMPVICLHGLTRNSKDFEDLAPVIAALGREVVAIDVRGRGRSDRDSNPDNYQPAKYVEDVIGILAELGWTRVVSVGTSMGGLMTMILAAMKPGLLEGVVLNDIGPELDSAGLSRIQSYVGGSAVYDSWDAAAEGVKAYNAVAFPRHKDDHAFWLHFARRTCREREDGTVVHDYDPAIASAVKQDDAGMPDLWPLFDALKPVPLLLIRGAITDLLSGETVAKMEARHPDMRVVNVADVGHAPLLTEPEALEAITEFLHEVE